MFYSGRNLYWVCRPLGFLWHVPESFSAFLELFFWKAAVVQFAFLIVDTCLRGYRPGTFVHWRAWYQIGYLRFWFTYFMISVSKVWDYPWIASLKSSPTCNPSTNHQVRKTQRQCYADHFSFTLLKNFTCMLIVCSISFFLFSRSCRQSQMSTVRQ